MSAGRIGCGRLLSEIAAWSKLSAEQRSAVCEAAAQRLRAHAPDERLP